MKSGRDARGIPAVLCVRPAGRSPSSSWPHCRRDQLIVNTVYEPPDMEPDVRWCEGWEAASPPRSRSEKHPRNAAEKALKHFGEGGNRREGFAGKMGVTVQKLGSYRKAKTIELTERTF